jgi:MFS family permease
MTFVLWLKLGHGYTPLHTGLTLLAFSAGAIVTAPNAGKSAESHGRVVLMSGAALLVTGMVIVGVPAWRSAEQVNAWYPLTGLFIAGAGLGLLVVPLVNVVLAAVPESAAGGASGLFSTAQQVGGALGVAVIGTVFFDHDHATSLNQSFGTAVLVVIGAYALTGLLSAFLPNRALSEDRVIDLK